MLRSAKLATPLTALRTRVPVSLPPDGLVPMATVIRFVAVVTVFPSVSWIAACTAGVIVTPTTVGPGWTVNATLAAAPAAMSKGPLVAAATPLAAAVSV